MRVFLTTICSFVLVTNAMAVDVTSVADGDAVVTSAADSGAVVTSGSDPSLPVLLLAFDSALTDTGTGSHTVTISSGTADYDTSTPAVGSGALDVAANSRYAVVTDAADLFAGDSDTPGSWSGWSKTSVTGTTQGIFSQYDGESNDIDFAITTADKFSPVFRGASTANIVPTQASACDGVWHHFAVTWELVSGTTWEFFVYRDGTEIYNNSLTWTPTGDTANLAVGARANGTVIHGGQIDDIRYWQGYVLSPAEVSALYALGTVSKPWIYTPANEVLSRTDRHKRILTSQFNETESCYAIAP